MKFFQSYSAKAQARLQRVFRATTILLSVVALFLIDVNAPGPGQSANGQKSTHPNAPTNSNNNPHPHQQHHEPHPSSPSPSSTESSRQRHQSDPMTSSDEKRRQIYRRGRLSGQSDQTARRGASLHPSDLNIDAEYESSTSMIDTSTGSLYQSRYDSMTSLLDMTETSTETQNKRRAALSWDRGNSLQFSVPSITLSGAQGMQFTPRTPHFPFPIQQAPSLFRSTVQPISQTHEPKRSLPTNPFLAYMSRQLVQSSTNPFRSGWPPQTVEAPLSAPPSHSPPLRSFISPSNIDPAPPSTSTILPIHPPPSPIYHTSPITIRPDPTSTTTTTTTTTLLTPRNYDPAPFPRTPSIIPRPRSERLYESQLPSRYSLDRRKDPLDHRQLDTRKQRGDMRSTGISSRSYFSDYSALSPGFLRKIQKSKMQAVSNRERLNQQAQQTSASLNQGYQKLMDMFADSKSLLDQTQTHTTRHKGYSTGQAYIPPSAANLIPQSTRRLQTPRSLRTQMPRYYQPFQDGTPMPMARQTQRSTVRTGVLPVPQTTPIFHTPLSTPVPQPIPNTPGSPGLITPSVQRLPSRRPIIVLKHITTQKRIGSKGQSLKDGETQQDNN